VANNGGFSFQFFLSLLLMLVHLGDSSAVTIDSSLKNEKLFEALKAVF
jgi:hypothetical protein